MFGARRGTEPEEPLIKGSVIREFVLHYEGATDKRFYVETLLEDLPLPLHDYVWADRPAFGIVASEWYPARLVHAFLDAAARIQTEEEFHARLAAITDRSVAKLIHGLYAVLFRMVASPTLYAKHVDRAWRMLHTTGHRVMTVVRSPSRASPGLIESTTWNWDGHHPWLCVITTETVRATFQAMGCTEVRVERRACISKGGAECLSWVHYQRS